MKLSTRFFMGMGSVISVLCAGAATGLIFSDVLPSWTRINLPFHSTIETLGGISALLITLVLLQQSLDKDRDRADMASFLVATGFACMGALDTFHAMCMPGEAFIFLHSAASLAGGFFFAGALLPDLLLKRYANQQRWFAGIAVILCLTVGLRAVFIPQDVPKIIPLYDGEFTLAAILINSLAGVFFLISVPGFYSRFRTSGNTDHLVFLFIALLFGLAELIFQYSDTWNAIWWAWHLLRFAAYIMTLLFVVNHHVRMVTGVSRNRDQSTLENTSADREK